MAGPIDRVIADLEEIVAECRARGDREGYFAAMYLAVTREIEIAVEADRFEDGPRMEQLDEVFARRYIDAYRGDQRGERVTESWSVSFEGATRRRPIIVQQLLTGMNAHINLDLGIAAATVAPGDKLTDLHNDFNTINEVLASLTGRFTSDIGRVSPWIRFLNRIGGSLEEGLIRFSIELARENAWKLATELAPVPIAKWDGLIGQRDRETAALARHILKPGVIMSAGLLVIRSRETNDVAKVIDELGRVGLALTTRGNNV